MIPSLMADNQVKNLCLIYSDPIHRHILQRPVNELTRILTSCMVEHEWVAQLRRDCLSSLGLDGSYMDISQRARELGVQCKRVLRVVVARARLCRRALAETAWCVHRNFPSTAKHKGAQLKCAEVDGDAD